MRIIFPDGQELDYPNAHFLEHGPTIHHLYARRGGKWIASVSTTAPVVIEADSRARTTPLGMLRYVAEHIEEYRDSSAMYELRLLKRALANFSTRTGWKRGEDGEGDAEDATPQE